MHRGFEIASASRSGQCLCEFMLSRDKIGECIDRIDWGMYYTLLEQGRRIRGEWTTVIPSLWEEDTRTILTPENGEKGSD